MSSKQRSLLRADEISGMDEYEAHHPLNPNSEVYIRSLSHALGLSRLGVHLARLAPGKEANVVHSHGYEEEFFYILSGRGEAQIDGESNEVGAGDFMAFRTPSVHHGLRNPFDEDLVYLVGGEKREFEVAEFPELGKLIVRERQRALVIERDTVEIWGRGDESEEPESGDSPETGVHET